MPATHTKQRLALAERHRQYVFPQPMRKMCWSKNTGKSWQIRCIMKKWVFLIHRTDFGNPIFAWRVFPNCWLASREHEADQHKTRSAWWLSAVSYFQSAALPSQAFFPGFFSPAFFFLFYARILMENAALQDQAKLARQTLCEPAQSKCTWTCHKSNFMQFFIGKKPGNRWSTLIKHRPYLLP